MVKDKIGMLFRLSFVLFLFCIVNLLFVTQGEPEYYILIISIILNGLIIVSSIIVLIKKKGSFD